MISNQIRKLVNSWQNALININGVKRQCEESIFRSLGSKPIKIITGFRRTGKSFLVRQLAKRVVESELYKNSNVLYLNFENYNLTGINTPNRLDEVYQMFKAEIASPGKMLLIFDEIQNVSDWDKFIRTIYEEDGENIEIIITGSNSQLLSSELSSNLAGRFIEFFVLPFSFKEFLHYHDIKITSENELLKNHLDVTRHFAEFLEYGGLPEVFSINDKHAKFSYLRGILSKVILDDIVERFNIKGSYIIEKIFYYMTLNIGNRVSFSKIASFLKDINRDTTQESVILYVQYIIRSFALYEIQRFDWKMGRIFETSRKYYSVDTGIVNSFDNTVNNYSKILENIVYLEIKRRENQINFGALATGKEIDFITKKRGEEFVKYQVTHELHEKNINRELSPFIMKGSHLETGDNILLSMNDENSEMDYKSIKIQQRDLIGWLLGL